MYLELKDINFSYGNTKILKNISFGASKGEIVGLIGANGVGKTTIINNIVRKLEAESGEILIDGININNIKNKDLKISYIPSEPVYYEELTLAEHIEFVKALYKNINVDTEEIVKKLELEEHLNKIPSQLSKGTLQKMMIALALIREHDLFVADEPFNGLDPKQIKVFKNILSESKENKKAIIISTHLLDMIEGICDKYVLIANGEIAAFGTKENIIKENNLDENCTIEEVYLQVLNKNGASL